VTESFTGHQISCSLVRGFSSLYAIFLFKGYVGLGFAEGLTIEI
jgi:hypothetical protein